MKTNFWQQLKKPIIGLSPMDGVTDQPFRYIQKKYGQPDIVYTEFASVEGVCHGATSMLKDFLYDETQRPVIAQVYGTTPDSFRQTATLLCQLGFDGIDINMGCPAKNVAHSGAGAKLITTPKLAQEIIKETKLGIEDWVNGKSAADCANVSDEITREVERRHELLPIAYQQRQSIPVSVKTRIGFDKPVIRDWMETLLEMEPVAIALHGRTLKQQYGGSADWEQIGIAAEIASKSETLILGNGDVTSLEIAHERASTYKLDGILIGRASFGNPFVFRESVHVSPTIYEIAVEHAEVFEKTYSSREKYSFLPMRKHLGWYVRGVPEAASIRAALFQTNSSQEVRSVLEENGLL
ncbi:MAG: hypothetical protein COY80_00625 [Candidatus Pacebacteria bacterium CG_4_10_14_0_8_um_filter_42_14]|nr:MAG: hypothetical protein COY80_00625 [Candidatus Pacebacteria bacterium CG_4_10_14_0_8_um_filter_42_14]